MDIWIYIWCCWRLYIVHLHVTYKHVHIHLHIHMCVYIYIYYAYIYNLYLFMHMFVYAWLVQKVTVTHMYIYIYIYTVIYIYIVYIMYISHFLSNGVDETPKFWCWNLRWISILGRVSVSQSIQIQRVLWGPQQRRWSDVTEDWWMWRSWQVYLDSPSTTRTPKILCYLTTWFENF